jgi:hypothetical protein
MLPGPGKTSELVLKRLKWPDNKTKFGQRKKYFLIFVSWCLRDSLSKYQWADCNYNSIRLLTLLLCTVG